jgi:methylmalonyl-CoA decarboxylase
MLRGNRAPWLQGFVSAGPEMRSAVETLVTTVNDGIGVITLKHGEVNPLSKQLIEDICSCLEHMKSLAVRVVILRAQKGVKVFCAGHDVKELPTNGRDPLTYSDPLRHLVRVIECEMVMSCDLIIATTESTFAFTPAKLGVPYNLSGMLNLMKVADIHFIKEMLFTAQPVGAERLAACGVINHVVPREQLESFTMELARQITETSPLVHRILKEELRVLAGAHPLNPEAYERIQSLRREVYDSSDYQEGIKAFLEKRKPVFQGK